MTEMLQFIPPTTGSCGVEDYAKHLASAWYGQLDAGKHVCVVGAQTRDLMAAPQHFQLKSRVATVVFHYSGYGYSKRGAPMWLVRFIQRFRKEHAGLPWITMFHEVAASGPVHTSAFWTRPLQLWVAKRLQQLSDAVFTNCSINSKILREASDNAAEGIHIVPVFSNFGEPSAHIPSRDRQSQMVIFTSNFGGRNPPPEFWQGVVQTIDLHRVARVVLIGRPVSLLPELPFPVQQCGFLEAGQVSELLQQSRFGYAFFGPLLLGKSGIFAAFAAHGVIPLIPTIETMLPDGLTSGFHYLRASDDSNMMELEAVQGGLLQWYRLHDLPTTAAAYLAAAGHLKNSFSLEA